MDTDVDLSQAVWDLFEREDYPAARAMLEARLADEPDSHWLLTRIGTTYYEERRYAEALAYEQRALRLAPGCPLVLWGLAGAHQMLGDDEAALRVYRRLIARGVERVGSEACGEGVRWARGLIADAHYRAASSLLDLGRPRAARNALDRHLALRGPGCSSIYPLREVRRRRAALA